MFIKKVWCTMDKRTEDVRQIRLAYLDVEIALRKVGTLLRTTDAGKYMWASDHRSAVTGLRVVTEKLREDVPRYDGS